MCLLLSPMRLPPTLFQYRLAASVVSDARAPNHLPARSGRAVPDVSRPAALIVHADVQDDIHKVNRLLMYSEQHSFSIINIHTYTCNKIGLLPDIVVF